MVSVNLAVKHKSFGDGVIVSTNGKYIVVKFASAQKTFVYPDIFESFLTLADGTIPTEIKVDLDAARSAKQAIIDKKNEENDRAMKKGIVLPGKEGAMYATDDEQPFKQQNENEEP